MPCIVTLAVVFALPIYYHSELMVLDLGGGNETENSDIEYNNIAYCIENWRFDDDQASDPERKARFFILLLYRVSQLTLSENKSEKDNLIDTFCYKNCICIFLTCGQLFFCSSNLHHIIQ